jgi:hypothetical protein
MLKIFFRRTLLLYTVHSAECLSNQIAAETELWKRWPGATSPQVPRTEFWKWWPGANFPQVLRTAASSAKFPENRTGRGVARSYFSTSPRTS